MRRRRGNARCHHSGDRRRRPQVTRLPYSSFRAASLKETGKAHFFLPVPGSHKWAQWAQSGARRFRHTQRRPLSRASHQPHMNAHGRTYGCTQAPPHGHEGTQKLDARKVLESHQSISLPPCRTRPRPTKENVSPRGPVQRTF